MKKILFTDLDGTLLNNRSQIDEEMKQALEGYLKVLYAQAPESVGGKLPGEDFYYVP